MSASKNMKRAAALKYERKKESDAPVIVASGLGYVAEQIVSIARENEIPVYQDDSLASVLTQLEVGSQIPAELYDAVVNLYIYFLNFTLPEKSK
ncbi:MAG: EscU/YscU/HrcU family type III secretion system export apparatus switch protein [Anaerofustis sp.]